MSLLQLHGELALSDLIVWERLEVRGKSNGLHGGNEPLGWVVLVPLDGISVVHGKLVMEIVVPLAKGQEGGEEVITRGVLVIVCRLSQVVRD